MNIKYFKGIVLSVFLGVFLFSSLAQARRVRTTDIEGEIEAKRDKESLVSQQLIQNGEATIEADDGVVFTLKLEKTTQDERFPGERYVVSVATADGVEIAHSCFRIHNEWAYGYEDFRQNDDFYYFAHPDNSGMSYSEWLNVSDGHNVDPALMVDKEYRLRYKGIGTTLACLELELSRMMGAEFFDALNVLDEGFHRVIGYQALPPNVETGGSLNMTFDLTDSSVVLSPIGITRRP